MEYDIVDELIEEYIGERPQGTEKRKPTIIKPQNNSPPKKETTTSPRNVRNNNDPGRGRQIYKVNVLRDDRLIFVLTPYNKEKIEWFQKKYVYYSKFSRRVIQPSKSQIINLALNILFRRHKRIMKDSPDVDNKERGKQNRTHHHFSKLQ